MLLTSFSKSGQGRLPYSELRSCHIAWPTGLWLKAIFFAEMVQSAGLGAGVLWRGFETYRQISFRNQCLVVSDWIKTKIFGRDVEFGQAEEEAMAIK